MKIRKNVKHLGSAQKLVHILYGKYPVPWGLLQTDYVKLFFNDPLGLNQKENFNYSNR